MNPSPSRLPCSASRTSWSTIVRATFAASAATAAFTAFAVLGGCGGGGDATDAGAGGTITDGGFLDPGLQPAGAVFVQAFQNFRSWRSTPGVGPAGAPEDVLAMADGGPHSFGPMTSYINSVPPPGSTSFPIGTIIVKETTEGPVTSHKIFAMEKRGGDFNSGGAVNWEWFELQSINESNVGPFVWRGYGPTNSMDSYGGDPQVCNGCHAMAAADDFVFTVGFASMLTH
jgi:hypothetical protein